MPADEVLLDDALAVLGRHVPIPRALGIDDGDGSADADAEASTARAIRRAVRPGEVQLLHPVLDVMPGRVALFGRGAVRPRAHEQVPNDLADAEGGCRRLRSGAFLGQRPPSRP